MKDINCPHCKHSYDADEPHFFGEDGDEIEEDCPSCGKKFKMVVSYSTSWDCTCADGHHVLCPDEGKGNWFNCEVCDEFMRDDGSPKITKEESKHKDDIPY